MSNMLAFVSAILGNTVSLLTGLIGLGATIYGVYYRDASTGKVLLAAGVLALIVSPCVAWIDEHKARLQLEAQFQTIRPFVLIEELPPEQIRTYMFANPKNEIRPEGAYGKGYITGKAPQGEAFFYNVRNAGKVPAHEVKYLAQITLTDNTGSEHNVQIQQAENNGEVLFPDQVTTRRIAIPDGTVFTAPAAASGHLRFTLVVTYAGAPSDRNTYFHKVVLRSARYRTLDEMNQSGVGNISPDFSDEGIVEDVNKLLK